MQQKHFMYNKREQLKMKLISASQERSSYKKLGKEFLMVTLM